VVTSFEDKSGIERIPPLPFQAMSLRVDSSHIWVFFIPAGAS
jgi:hypothetical protein